MAERDPAYLSDMVMAAREVSGFVARKQYSDLISDRVLRLAIERGLEIIGEAAKGISQEFREEHPEIPWAAIIGQRNVISHEYGDIKLEWIWRVATTRIPALIVALEPLIPSLPEGD